MAITFVASSTLAPGTFDFSAAPDAVTPGLANYVSHSTNVTVSGLSCSVTPGTLVNGDLLLANVFLRQNVVVTPPAGWTSAGRADGGSVSQEAFYKVITNAGSEPAFYEWVVGATAEIHVLMTQFRGCDTADPIWQVAVSGQSIGTALSAVSSSPPAEYPYVYVGFASGGTLSDWQTASGPAFTQYVTSTPGIAAAYGRGNRDSSSINTITCTADVGSWLMSAYWNLRPAQHVAKVTIAKPAGAVENDVLVVCLASGTHFWGTPPSSLDWAMIQNVAPGDVDGSFETGTDGTYIAFLWKRLTSSEPSSYEFQFNDRGGFTVMSMPYHGWIRAYRGVILSGTPIDDYEQGYAAGASLTLPSMTASNNGSMVVSAAATRGNNIITVTDPPYSVTLDEGPHASGNATTGAMTEATANAGPTDAIVWKTEAA